MTNACYRMDTHNGWGMSGAVSDHDTTVIPKTLRLNAAYSHSTMSAGSDDGDPEDSAHVHPIRAMHDSQPLLEVAPDAAPRVPSDAASIQNDAAFHMEYEKSERRYSRDSVAADFSAPRDGVVTAGANQQCGITPEELSQFSGSKHSVRTVEADKHAAYEYMPPSDGGTVATGAYVGDNDDDSTGRGSPAPGGSITAGMCPGLFL
jgi:hypothetical protein